MSKNQKQNILPQNLDAKYAPKNSRHWNWMQKPKPKFVGTELMSRSYIWKNALQMEEIN